MNEQKTKNIVVDDMFLTTDMPTSAGSKMLDGYQSLIDAEALTKVLAAGYTLTAKTPAGEFAIDILGETAVSGAWINNGILKNATAQMLLWGDAMGALCLDVNGYPRRAAAQTGDRRYVDTFEYLEKQRAMLNQNPSVTALAGALAAYCGGL